MKKESKKVNVYFSDYFNVPEKALSEYGAFNISLINDLPVFIDPFLLFSSEKDEYSRLHSEIIKYVSFLREVSSNSGISQGLLRHWFLFPEVRQNWLGYSRIGNGGTGLGRKFAAAMNENLNSVFNNFGSEQITRGSHLEKLCLIDSRVGKDNISDFTTNLILDFLCVYTEKFARAHIADNRVRRVSVKHALFDYRTRRWVSKCYVLPYIDGDFVLLTPKDILTKDDAWINKHDIVADFEGIVAAIPNLELRAQINDYFLRQIPDDATVRETNEAVSVTLRQYPVLIDHYIRYKEDNADQASQLSKQKITETEAIFIRQVTNLIEILRAENLFYKKKGDTFEEAYQRVAYLKQVIEKNNGYKVFYHGGVPIGKEADLQLIFRLTWFASDDDVNSEVDNGRGPVDYKISRGSKDSTLVEFKLASNSKLKQNLQRQVEVYKEANQTKKAIKVIMYFTDEERQRTLKILKELNLVQGKEIVLIDARNDNKPSGSKTR